MAVPTVPDFNAGVLTTTDLAALAEAIDFVQRKPLAQMRQTVSQNITTSTFTAVTFTTEDFDSEGGHDNSTNTTRYTATEDGWYRVSGGWVCESNATGRRLSRWTKNGTEVNGSRIDLTAITGGESIVPSRDMVISLLEGEYVELEAWQNSGGTRATVVTTALQSTMTVEWVRRSD